MIVSEIRIEKTTPNSISSTNIVKQQQQLVTWKDLMVYKIPPPLDNRRIDQTNDTNNNQIMSIYENHDTFSDSLIDLTVDCSNDSVLPTLIAAKNLRCNDDNGDDNNNIITTVKSSGNSIISDDDKNLPLIIIDPTTKIFDRHEILEIATNSFINDYRYFNNKFNIIDDCYYEVPTKKRKRITDDKSFDFQKTQIQLHHHQSISATSSSSSTISRRYHYYDLDSDDREMKLLSPRLATLLNDILRNNNKSDDDNRLNLTINDCRKLIYFGAHKLGASTTTRAQPTTILQQSTSSTKMPLLSRRSRRRQRKNEEPEEKSSVARKDVLKRPKRGDIYMIYHSGNNGTSER